MFLKNSKIQNITRHSKNCIVSIFQRVILLDYIRLKITKSKTKTIFYYLLQNCIFFV